MHRRGDTIIEVMLAVTIFSMVAVGAMTVMNSGLAIAQRSLEVTQARQQVDAQAEMLRFVHDRSREDRSGQYASLWSSIQLVDAPQQLINTPSCPAKIDNSIALFPSAGEIRLTTNYGEPGSFSRIDGDVARGISIQVTKVSGGRAYDAYIQACWDSPGSSQPVTIGTIVRLYDPEA